MSATAMHEPVVDFLVPEFHGPAEIGYAATTTCFHCLIRFAFRHNKDRPIRRRGRSEGYTGSYLPALKCGQHRQAALAAGAIAWPTRSQVH